MSSVREAFNRVVWNEDFWLPPNVTWAVLQPTEEFRCTKYQDLIYPLFLALGVIAIKARIIFTKKICREKNCEKNISMPVENLDSVKSFYGGKYFGIIPFF